MHGRQSAQGKSRRLAPKYVSYAGYKNLGYPTGVARCRCARGRIAEEGKAGAEQRWQSCTQLPYLVLGQAGEERRGKASYQAPELSIQPYLI